MCTLAGKWAAECCCCCCCSCCCCCWLLFQCGSTTRGHAASVTETVGQCLCTDPYSLPVIMSSAKIQISACKHRMHGPKLEASTEHTSPFCVRTERNAHTARPRRRTSSCRIQDQDEIMLNTSKCKLREEAHRILPKASVD